MHFLAPHPPSSTARIGLNICAAAVFELQFNNLLCLLFLLNLFQFELLIFCNLALQFLEISDFYYRSLYVVYSVYSVHTVTIGLLFSLFDSPQSIGLSDFFLLLFSQTTLGVAGGHGFDKLLKGFTIFDSFFYFI